ncbi:MAG: SPASM domain-containing protein, partial [Bacteroidales bacterium]|nr:SPASM domain-containing protein [Bacteroidales bacterium]
TAFGQDHTLCIFKENCGGVPVVELNGNFYSCDHYVNSDNLIGNINTGTIAEFLDSKRQKEFGMAKSLTLPRYCLECDVRSMCNGECPKNRFISTPDGEPGLNYLCEGYKAFFRHCKPFVDAIGGIWNEQMK